MTQRSNGGARAAALVLAAGLADPAAACEVAILFAIDVSASVDAGEYALQSGGHAAAITDPEVIDAIQSIGGVQVTLMHWSGGVHQELRTPWTALSDAASAHAYAARLAQIERRVDSEATALGSALNFVEHSWPDEARRCRRRVVDISGDGVSNTGVPIAPTRARLIEDGVTLNGLVIGGGDPPPAPFYRERVIGGPGAFLEIAEGYADYARAFKLKLLRELRQVFAETAR